MPGAAFAIKGIVLLLSLLVLWQQAETCRRTRIRITPRMQGDMTFRANRANNKARVYSIGRPGWRARVYRGHSVRVQQIGGPRPGGWFAKGRHTITYKFSTRGYETWGSTHVTVRVEYCSIRSTQGYFANGRRICSSNCEEKNVEGAWCTYDCYTGYELQPKQNYMSCLAPRWSLITEPRCVRINCGSPSPPQDGQWNCSNGYNNPNICELRCNAGFEPRGLTLTTCELSKTWTHTKVGSNRLCRDVLSPTFPAGCVGDIEAISAPLGELKNVSWTAVVAKDNSGASPNVTYRLPGTSVRTASRFGDFKVGRHEVKVFAEDQEGNVGTCQFIVTVNAVTCPRPRESLNNTQMIFRPNPTADVPHGTSINITCPQGYVQHGSTVIMCELDATTGTASWTWDGDREARRPACNEVPCPELEPPKNGALGCFTSTVGTDCLMFCSEGFDVPLKHRRESGSRFTCTFSRRIWFPLKVPDCTVIVAPGSINVTNRILFNYRGDCPNVKETLKQNFITRISSNVLTQDACDQQRIPSCTAENVQIYCGQVSTSGRRRRDTPEYTVTITFDVTVPGNTTPEVVREAQANLTRILRQAARAGNLTFDGLTANESSIQTSKIDCDCPSGRTCLENSASTSFTCVGCSKGQYMVTTPEGDAQCEECPQGTYQSEEGATECTSCPTGMSTASNGSHNVSQCEEPGAGGWGEWDLWSECSQTCGGGVEHRHRRCDNPPPEPNGRYCEGEANETRACGEPFCVVDGNWGQWGQWSNCSVPCDGGEITRSRQCDSPAPQHGGETCSGPDVQRVVCNTQNCPVDGGWGNWTEWTECSASCEGGTQTRKRPCDNPPPAFGGDVCSGEFNQTQACNSERCPECPACQKPPNAEEPQVVSDGEDKNCSITCLPGYQWAMDFSPLLYCGPNTSYIWSSYPDISVPVGNAMCAMLKSSEGGELAMNFPLNQTCTADDPAITKDVKEQIEHKVNSLPCKNGSSVKCNTTLSVACATFRPSNSTLASPDGDSNSTESSNETTTTPGATTQTPQKFLYVSFAMDGRLERSMELKPGSREYDEYAELANATEESVRLVTEETKQMFRVIINGTTVEPNDDEVSLESRYICPAGTGDLNGFCVDCPSGTYDDTSMCEPCPVDHYQDETMATACKPCPDGCTTYSIGSFSIAQCICPTKSKTTSVTPAQTTSPVNTPQSKEVDGGDDGLVLGVSVGVSAAVVVVVVVAVGVWCWLKRRKDKVPITLRAVFKHRSTTTTTKDPAA